MTAANHALRDETNLPHPLASRKDVLGLAQAHPWGHASGPEKVRQQLASQGFRITQPQPGHWVLTLTSPLPELHFYSELELAQFAGIQAINYSTHYSGEAQ